MIESFLELSKYLVMKLTSYPGHLSFLMSGNGEGVLFVPWACPISGGEVPSGPQWLPGVSRAGCGFRVGWRTAGGV